MFAVFGDNAIGSEFFYWVFAEVNQLKIEARRRGEDIVDLGFGNPDIPSPPLVVDKLVEAARNDRKIIIPRSGSGRRRKPTSKNPSLAPLFKAVNAKRKYGRKNQVCRD